ncbi:MAG: hypothetical protein JRE71_15570 [Deltaproteobacteria bacterium]|nr:hypothetical protein [Deltaproteobacteria bacterium]
MTSSSSEQPDRRDYWSIFLVSCAVMLYQITLTRVLSVVVWYHFAFLTISLVMLGLGAPGVWFALARKPLRYLPALLLASGIAVPVSVMLVVKFGTEVLINNALGIAFFVLPATLSLGGVVCLLLMKASGAAITRMYGVDLLGAGLGAAVVIPLMHIIPTPLLAAGVGFLPLVALALYPGVMRRASVLCILLLTGTLVQGDGFQITRSKEYDEKIVRPVYEDWSPIARITIFDESFHVLAAQKSGFSWGRGSKFPEGERFRQYWLEQDGSAGTPISEFSGDLSRVRHLLYDVTTVGYQLRPPRSVAIIGAGGGRDILSALLAGATDIDAVELNSHTIDAVSNRFGDFSGDIYHVPGVTAVASDGRSHLSHTDKTFDLIQISLIDSWAASAAGAFALAENSLYTVEAFELYGSRLNDAGLISTSRWMTEMPRLIVLADASLRAMGIDEPRDHIVIVSAESVGTLLTSKQPFSSSDLQRLREICEQRGFVQLYPVAPGTVPANRFIAATVHQGLTPLAKSGINTDPPTDDSPYFFHMMSPFSLPDELPDEIAAVTGMQLNLQSSYLLRIVMLGVTATSIVFFMLPFLVRLGRAESAQSWPSLLRATTYFAMIGFAFMLIENVLVQRFVLYLGHPSYAMTVIIASLLLGMGAGSTYAELLGVERLKRQGMLVPLLLLALVFILPGLFAVTLGLPLALRVAISGTILIPLGATLGVFFPLGMLRFGDRAKPWYWAINGVFGVVASVLSLALSMEIGFAAVGVLAAFGYAVAWACLHGSEVPSSVEAVMEAVEAEGPTAIGPPGGS